MSVVAAPNELAVAPRRRAVAPKAAGMVAMSAPVLRMRPARASARRPARLSSGWGESASWSPSVENKAGPESGPCLSVYQILRTPAGWV